MKKKLLIVGLLVLLVLILDQILKIWVKTTFTVYDEPKNLLGDWFRLIYIENQGMAFGTTFGASMWAKLALSVFRIGAIIGIGIYWFRQAKTHVRLEFLIAVGFIFAGATGNLIDSMCYDFVFKYDPCLSFNLLEGSGIKTDCGIFGQQETRHTGFLFGNVVDMFQFNFTWPTWVPWLGGSEVFPAIWNIADASISIGVGMILIRQRKYFPKKGKSEELNNSEELKVKNEE
ncbi:MAG: signal peptidase II [Bacteroidota bacterium]